MNIGKYSFSRFCQLAENFHGYPAPGLLIGGYMVSMAMRPLPEGTLFEAVVETKKCLPDAVHFKITVIPSAKFHKHTHPKRRPRFGGVHVSFPTPYSPHPYACISSHHAGE